MTLHTDTLTKLHETNGKLDLIANLKISGLTLDQQEQLLYTNQQLLNKRFELIKQIRKEYIL